VRNEVEKQTTLPSLTAAHAFGCAVIVSGMGEEETGRLCLALASALDCRCLYGTPRDSAEELAQSYGNLLDLWQRRFLYAGQQVLSEKLTANYDSPLDFRTQDTEPLFAFLRTGQLEEARSEWKRIFDRIRSAKFNDFRFFVRYILNHLHTMQSELGLELLVNAQEILEDLEDIAHLHHFLDSMFTQIVAAQSSRRKDSLQQLAAKINERIDVGFADDSLSAQSIADEMGMNAAYIGRLYRECTGISIGAAIKQIRIENAKRLLKEIREPVKEIAGRVGFSNTKYFFVVFKELVGMTPKEFQNRE
jgi:YesN/AraC family two-component response regulator